MDERAMSDLAAMGRQAADDRQASADERPGVISLRGDEEWTPYQLSTSGIAVIPVKGVLKREWGIGPYSGCTGYDGIMTQVIHAQQNDRVQQLWFDINSGGGAVDGCFDLTDAIYEMSARFGGKKMTASASFACSAAYAIAAACDEIVSPVLGRTGSIGCVVICSEVSRLLEKEGVTVTIVRSRPGKHKPNGVEAMDDETLAYLQDAVDEVDEFFVERLTAYRPGLTEKSISELAGRDYTGRRALATGLIDFISSEPDAWARVEQDIAAKGIT
jgi:signal peptide peptidase SppA